MIEAPDMYTSTDKANSSASSPLERRLAVGLIVGLMACVVGLCVGPGVAFATRAHVVTPSVFGGPGSESGQLSLGFAATRRSPGSGVAVSSSTHDVYVADTGNRRVAEYSPSGAFIRAWGWGVATGANSLEVCTVSCRQGLSGEAAGEFVAPVYVAVDNDPSSPSAGDVYVGDSGDALVTKFDSEGHLIETWGNNGGKGALDGQLNGSPELLFNGGFPEDLLAGVGIDPGTGNLIVAEAGSRVFSFKQDGSWIATCKAAEVANAKVGGLALDGTGQLYVIDSFGTVFRVQPACAGTGEITRGGVRATGIAADTLDDSVYVVEEGALIEDIPATCVPSTFGCATTQEFGEGHIKEASGIAVDAETGALYVANGATDQVALFALALEAITDPPSEVNAHEALLHARVNPAGTELTICSFEYGETEAYGFSAPCEESLPSIGNGHSLVSVQAKISHLAGGHEYHFRLRAANGAGSVLSEDRAFPTTQTAQVVSVGAKEVTGGSAVLGAEVNPEGLAARYRFEYGPCSSAVECHSSPYAHVLPEAELAASNAVKPVTAAIEGLTDGTTYHFRITVEDTNGVTEPTLEGTFAHVASSAICSLPRPGLDEGLPDCRSYEMVTPLNKDGALIDNGGLLTRPAIATDGSRVLVKSIQCFEKPKSCTGVRQTEGEPYSFARGESGWQTEPLAPPATPANSMLNYNAETGVVLYALAAEPPALEQFYAREPNGELAAIGPLAAQAGSGPIGFVATERLITTADLSRIVYNGFDSWPALEVGVINNTTTVFEYSGRAQSSPELVAVTGGSGSTSLIGACNSSVGSQIGGEHNSYGSVSSDGREVLFTVSACPTGTGANTGIPVPADRLYARVEGEHGMATVLLSGPGGALECNASCQSQPPADAVFQGASPDSSHVVFTSSGQLTDKASEDARSSDSAALGCPSTSSDASGCNLYLSECPNPCENASQRHLVDLSAGDTSGVGPQVQAVYAIAADGSVYFIAHGVLTDSAGPLGAKAVPGGENLYVYRAAGEGSAGGLSFVTTLAHSDRSQWIAEAGLGRANVTPDGRYLVFTSHRSLTPDAEGGEGPEQVYRYDAQTQQLLRVSVGQQGFNDNGNSAVVDARIAPAVNGFEADGPDRANPTMSDDGQIVFFETPTGLTPNALDNHPVTGNSKVLAEDVYEWEAQGAEPSLEAPPCDQRSGCVHLISDGKDVTEGSGAHQNTSAVELLSTDATGSNVFFWTADQLVGRDTDSQLDLYDARVDGGFAEPAPPVHCESIPECHGEAPSAPVFGPPGSTIFLGLGNMPLGTEEMSHARGIANRKLTPAEQLSQALKACRARSAGRARKTCESHAHATYGAQLLAAALRACAKKSGTARKGCERSARLRYGAPRGKSARRRTAHR